MEITEAIEISTADPTDCQRACYALFPNAYFVGVRQTDDEGSLKCFCAKMGAFKSTVGLANIQDSSPIQILNVGPKIRVPLR